jgi:hypothetical protein
MWTMLSVTSDGWPTIGMAGHHEDTLTKEDAVWKLLRRQGHIDVGSLPIRSSKTPTGCKDE